MTPGDRVDHPDLSGMADAHRRLRRHVHSLLHSGLLDDRAVAEPSLLPGWTRGHVLTHVARHADSTIRALTGAARGDIVARYPGPPGSRDREIEHGANRTAAALVADVVDTSVALDEVVGSLPEAAWSGRCHGRTGEEPVSALPAMRQREVEFHLADLDLPGFGAADWSPELVAAEARRLGRPGADATWVAEANGRPGIDPAAWTAATLAPDWCRPFHRHEIEALDRALGAYRASTGGLELTAHSGRHFPTDDLDHLVAGLRNRLVEGDGVAAFEGFPVDRYTTDELRVIWWGLANAIGHPRPQSHRGDLIGDVRDIGTGITGRTGRGYTSNAELNFHADACDVSGLFFLRTARDGGVTRVASSVATHDRIAARHPDLLAELYRPLPCSWQGNQPEGEPGWYRIPVFGRANGRVSCVYVRTNILLAAENAGAPPLTDRQVEAVQLVKDVASEPDLSVERRFEPGAMLFVHNHTVLHLRTRFIDWDEPGRKRHLLRVWLSMPNNRELPATFGEFFDDLRPGALRGGYRSRTGAPRGDLRHPLTASARPSIRLRRKRRREVARTILVAMLTPYRVLDLADERGLFCSRVLSELGADVIHVEPPGGSPARHRGPHAAGTADPERSITWWAMARGTRSVVLDLDEAHGRRSFEQLVAGADVLIESADPGHWEATGLGYETMAELNPQLVWVSITPFGSDGPKAGYEATDLIVQAASGAMTLTGAADRRPLRASAVPAWTHAGAEAAGGALIALRAAQRSGRGQRVEVSAQRATNLTAQFSLPAAAVGHRRIRRAGGFSLQGIDFPFIWEAADGYVSLTVAIDPLNKPFLDRLLAFMIEEGHAAAGVTDRDWVVHLRSIRSGDAPAEDLAILRDAVAAFVATKTKGDLFAAALDRKLLLVPVADFDDLYRSDQLGHRRFWTTEELPDGSDALLPDHLVRSSLRRERNRRPAPAVGAHTDEVLADPRPPHPSAPPRRNREPAAASEAPLAGVNVLDLMWVMAGPTSTGVLAQYGATVVKVENEARMDTARLLAPWYDGKAGKERSLGFGSINVNKLSITIDPNTAEGRDVILDLVRWADVVTESFSPKAMRAWGLDYDSLRAVKPDVIMLSSCLMGQDGPHATVAGYGTMGSAAAGLVPPTGWADRAPNGPYGAYTDYCAPRVSVAALLAALDHRHRTGQGQYLDQSQVESTLNYAAPALLDHQVNGTTWDRLGNGDPDQFPHDAFPSSGYDEWVAIACRHDDDWRRLCGVLDRDEWAHWDLTARRARATDIEHALSAWTSTRSPEAAEVELQRAGIPAHGVLHTGSPPDPQLEHLQHLVDVDHVEFGPRPIERTRIQLTRTPPAPAHVPKIGQHTEHVLRGILGYDEARIDSLRAAGALGTSRKR